MTRHIFDIRGHSYPCYMTMGALGRYARLTGRNFGEAGASLPDMLKFCYCMTAAACNAEGVAFDLDADTFADCLPPEEFAAWCASLSDDGDDDGQEATGAEKKSD